MKYILSIIVSIVIGLFIGYQIGTNSGFKIGKEEGYVLGYSEGEIKGKESGINQQKLTEELAKMEKIEALKKANNSEACNKNRVLENFNKYMKELHPNHKIDSESIMISDLENCRYMIRFKATEAYNPEGYNEFYHRHRVILFYSDDFETFGIDKIDFIEL